MIIGGGGGYYGGPGPRYWNDGPGYRRPPPQGGWGDRGGNRGNQEGMEAAIGAVMAARKRADHKGAGRSSRRRAIRAGLHQPQAQQSRGSTPYVGRSLWGKQPAQQPENNH